MHRAASLPLVTTLHPTCRVCVRLSVSLSYRGRKTAARATAAAGSAASNGVVNPVSSFGTVVTDDAVPEGHKGLHGFLYGEEGAEQHGVSSYYTYRQGEDDGATLLSVGTYLTDREGEKPLGVYAMYDGKANLQYVGYSRNIVLAVKAHLARVGEERCALVRTMVFRNKAMATRTNLEREVANWLEAAGTTPPGNGVDRELWESSNPAIAYMSPAERTEYEEKKLKMQKAMGEIVAQEVEGEEPDARERRLTLMKAMEGDDWSAVIDGQTAQAVGPKAARPASSAPAAAAAAAAPPPAPAPLISPFTRASVHRSIGNKEGDAGPPAMTVASVDEALNEVRPYLNADGGDVEVVGVEGGNVLLRLQGACGTCPSSTATMKMGIERALRSKFGEQLLEVMQVDAQDLKASVEAIDEQLNQLRPAIRSYGGEVVVLSLQDGVVTMRYKGPKPIQMGVKAAVKDKFPDVKDVVFVDQQ